MSRKKQRVLIVEDHPVVREGIKQILRKGKKFTVVKETGDAEEGLAYATKSPPDLALIDIRLSGTMNGISLTRLLTEAIPQLPIIIMTVHTKADIIGQALDSGALGFVNKESAGDVLLEAIKHVMANNHYIDPCLSPDLVRKLKDFARIDRAVSDTSYRSLSRREQEVLSFLAEHMTAKQVSEKIDLKVKTIENYRVNIYKKLGLKNRAELLRFCIKVGISDPDIW